jgi:hypothetical protein
MDFQHTFATPSNTNDDFTVLLFSKDQSENILSPYTHIITRDDLTIFWLNHFDNEKMTIINSFFMNKLKLLYRKNGYSLFEITN